MVRKRRELPWLDTREGTYHAFWYDSASRHTKRLSLRTKHTDEAARRFAAFLVEGGECYRPTEPVGLTVGRALDDYFEEHVKIKVVDQDRIEIAITHLKAFFDTTPMKDVDIPMSRAYVVARKTGAVAATRRGRKLTAGDATIRRELSVLVSAAGHAIRWRRLPASDKPSVELPDKPAGKERWLSHDEFQRLRAAATGRTRDFIDVAYDTAGRRRAVEALTIFQVDIERGRINLLKAGERQTKKRKAIVPITVEMKPLYARLVKKAKDDKTEYLLGHGGSVRKGFTAAVRKAGLGPDVTPHTLRHTRATHMLQAGKSPWAVAGWLGDTVQTVIDTYGHHCPNYLEEAMRAEPQGEELLK